ncbi:sushi, nidogen and EGF-like domain-containing protein 1 [Myxocyprinus asiaticus]|uniref:sushi, nidogen and EGF-like domain-containing protein 1 n=1 Tax=Myxocyprinus asiaticus TaxID=70543 RepID=UPI002221571F|nr:sushi, nidogen and EGF-like domain-containing protein 1 [Myxocyprinus asiaticus]
MPRVTQHLLVFTIIFVLPLVNTTTSMATTGSSKFSEVQNITQSTVTQNTTTTIVNTTTDTTTTGSSNFSGIFYPFGSAAGDTSNSAVDDGSSTLIGLLSPFIFFERTYLQIYVNNNGHLTFNQPSGQYIPFSFPAKGSQDIIAAFWTDLDNRRGVVSYQQYTNGSVLTHATQDIKQYFPDLSLNATWVFVATWDKVAYCCTTNTETSFQVVLISTGNSSFILMNYGDIAGRERTIAGYDTVMSTHYFVIPGSNNGSFIPNLKFSSNVNVTGRWAFRVDSEPSVNIISKENVIGLQVKLTSFLDLTQNGNIKIVLDELKQELIKYGLPNSIELNLRKLQKTKP